MHCFPEKIFIYVSGPNTGTCKLKNKKSKRLSDKIKKKIILSFILNTLILLYLYKKRPLILKRINIYISGFAR